jgi:Zn-dependent peptidase ImmA (M78 family)/predicted secreted protein
MPASWRQIHIAAAAEAIRAHSELSIDTSRPIDPFDALQRAGVLVMRQPLDRLSGAYLPLNANGVEQPGVLINVSHPLSRQRYTAAHELWHHRRDREFVFDEDTEWLARGESGDSDRERLAEAFASWFLMPDRLVRGLLESMNASRRTLDASLVYALALELGTSYAATIHRLHGLKVITAGKRDRLLKTTPQSIKRSLGVLDVAVDAWRDVHRVGPGDRSRVVDAVEGDVVVLDFAEVPSSGFLWYPASVPSIVDLVREEYQPVAPDVLGGSGTHRFVFSVTGSGDQPIRFELARPWQLGTVSEARSVHVASHPKPVPGIVDPLCLIPAAA